MAKPKRTIKGFARTGKISRKDARAAVREVGRTRSSSSGRFVKKSKS